MAPELFTSIPPDRYSAACVASWRAAGFHVVSVNHRIEARAIRDFGIDVAEFDAGSLKPGIGSILAAIAERNPACAGIINADCQIISGVKAATIASQTNSAMIMCRRINIDDFGSVAKNETQGFDAFFFDPKPICAMPKSAFTMGEPWWDYWFPTKAHQLGVRLYRGTPILVHKDHPDRWHPKNWDDGLKNFLTATRDGRLPFKVSNYSDELALACLGWLCARPPVDLIERDISLLLFSYSDRALHHDIVRQTKLLTGVLPRTAFRLARAALRLALRRYAPAAC